ncbi:hypothetical protein WS45_07660 [Burkholderia sp. RF2-non_BP3]|nr:hypothetical protein [Burkholderia sp. RF2-non_BP3]KUY60164.1 hypothetical protein WS45_07660 [Burkholderia sp. RF2-non_BP3]
MGSRLFADSLRPRWFVAGGTGLATVLSMLRRMAEYQERGDAREIAVAAGMPDAQFASERFTV